MTQNEKIKGTIRRSIASPHIERHSRIVSYAELVDRMPANPDNSNCIFVVVAAKPDLVSVVQLGEE